MNSKKFPSFSQWKQIFKVLKGFERKIFIFLVILFLASGVYLLVDLYIKNTKSAPTFGGSYTEGVVGQPRFINPVYGETNDIDRALIDLVYSGIMTYDKDGQLVNDLIENYQISENGKIYTFWLKDNLFWHDGIPLTTDDIIYTIKVIQNSDYKSPIRANWLNVLAEKVDDKSFTFSLATPYNSFLENCTVKIIPQHIWKNIVPENFSLSAYNLQPIGSGPYMVSDIDQTNIQLIKSLSLKVNSKYYDKVPYISNLLFRFFENKEDLIKAADQKTIDGFSLASLNEDEVLNEKFNVYSFSLPRYFAVFFNGQKNKLLSDINITKALNYSIDKENLIEKIGGTSKKEISVVDSPIIPEYFGYSPPTVVYDYSTEAAAGLFDKAGFKDSDSGKRTKADAKQPAFQFKNYLKQGSKGNEVTELQGCLSRLDENFKKLLESETNGTYGIGTENAITEFQKKYLPEAAPTGEAGPGTRKKLNELCVPTQNNSTALKFVLTTINQPQLTQVAEILKDFWQKVGVTIDIKIVELSELKDIIKYRDYEALLYGQALGYEPDLYPFWHSTQINDPGLNLSIYQNKNADQLLKDARETMDKEIKAQKYETLQNQIISDSPAVFLYNPDYIYWVSQKVKGIDTAKIVDPAKRFANIENWYINTKRIYHYAK